MKQFLITPAAGKRLISKALATHPAVMKALKSGTLVILAGTTNGYVAEEVLKAAGIPNDFSRKHFFRGIIMPAVDSVTSEGRLADESKFPGDVIISHGKWLKGKVISDVIDTLKEGDVILKGANALDLQRRQAAILIGHPKAGTIALAIQAILGRRILLILPVGLEKRVSGDLHTLAAQSNSPGAEGYRLFPVPGQVFTELDAITLLTGANAKLIAAGGVSGAEGSYILAISGTKDQEEATEKLLSSVASEPAFEA